MQLLVLYQGEHGLAAVQDRMALALDVGVPDRIHDPPVGLGGVLPHRLAAGPGRDRGPVRRVLILGVDAAGEEHLEPGVDARAPEPALDEGVHAERGDVSLVEDHRMTEGYRLLVVGVGGSTGRRGPRSGRGSSETT